MIIDRENVIIDRENVIKGLDLCIKNIDRECPIGCPYHEICTKYEGRVVFQPVLRDALDLLNEQKAEIERLIKEKQRVIEQIENEINRLHKESRYVKDEVGTATYEWLINGFQASLDMIKDGGQELVNKERK